MHPEIEALLRRIRAQTEALTGLAESLDDARLFTRPAEGRWSPGEHIAHVVATTRAYLEEIRTALEGASPPGSAPPRSFKRGWVGQFLVRAMRPPPRSRMKTFKSMEPPEELERAPLLADFRATQGELEGALENADGLDLGRVRMKNPFIPLLRMRLVDGIEVIVTHTDRHHWLIREALGEVSAP